MQKMFMFLCSLFILSCVFSTVGIAEEKLSPGMEAYKKAVADQEMARKARAEKWAQEEAIRKAAELERAETDKLSLADKAAREKECGADFGRIQLGMLFPRVEKCVGEFTLRGQTQLNGGVVEQYSRGNMFVYIKDGKVVSWSE